MGLAAAAVVAILLITTGVPAQAAEPAPRPSTRAEAADLDPALNLGHVSNYFSGLDMNIKGASSANGAQAIQWPASDALPNNDLFYFEHQPISGDYWYRIKAVHSNKCLAVKDASMADNAPIIQWDCSYDSWNNDVWGRVDVLVWLGDLGIVLEEYRNLRSGKCIHVQNASKNSGAALVQWSCNQSKNSLWDVY